MNILLLFDDVGIQAMCMFFTTIHMSNILDEVHIKLKAPTKWMFPSGIIGPYNNLQFTKTT